MASTHIKLARFVRRPPDGVKAPFARGDSGPISRRMIDANGTELPLPAGYMTAGLVRVGDTVRRPRTPSSPFVAQLLAYLGDRGCAWAPRYLGQDSLGRDVLTFLPGTTPGWSGFTDDQLRAAATIVRQLHDLTRGSPLAPTSVVCHNDAAPNNFVFSAGVPVGLIDFDSAGPGEPLEDLAYMVWGWCISSKPARGPVGAQARQVRSLADAYGLAASDRMQLPDAIITRQVENVRFWSDRLERPGSTPTSPTKIVELIAWSEREARFVGEHRAQFMVALE